MKTSAMDFFTIIFMILSLSSCSSRDSAAANDSVYIHVTAGLFIK